MTISCDDAMNSQSCAKRKPVRAIRIHLYGAAIHTTFTSLTLTCHLRRGEAADQVSRTAQAIRLVLSAGRRWVGSASICLKFVQSEESFMTRSIGAAILALTLMLGGSAAFSPAAGAPLQTALREPHAWKATDLSARRRYRHHYRYAYRPYYRPYYYDRPYYYAPAPFFPFLGLGYGPWW